MATSTTSSLYSTRKRERAMRYLAGASRASYRLAPTVQSSLSSPDTSLIVPEDTTDDLSDAMVTKRARRESVCTRGCQSVLKRLATTYNKIGQHTGRTAQHRIKSHPYPKKGAPPRNITSKAGAYTTFLGQRGWATIIQSGLNPPFKLMPF